MLTIHNRGWIIPELTYVTNNHKRIKTVLKEPKIIIGDNHRFIHHYSQSIPISSYPQQKFKVINQ